VPCHCASKEAAARHSSLASTRIFIDGDFS
jgi:hypothetical protein